MDTNLVQTRLLIRLPNDFSSQLRVVVVIVDVIFVVVV